MGRCGWNDEVFRVNKGKYGSKVHADILEQCSEEQSIFSNSDDVYPANAIGATQIDTRTFDTIMLEAFDAFKCKSFLIRSNAIRTVCTQLRQTHNPDFLERHYDTLIITIRKALEGKISCEIDEALTLLSLAAIQLPNTHRSIQHFYEPLIAALNDERLRLSTRYAVLHAIGMLTLFYETDRHQIYIIMKRFKDIFTVKMKSNKATKSMHYEWQRAAWTWTFLFTLLVVNKRPFFWSHILKYIEKELETPPKQLTIGKCRLNLGNGQLRVTYEMVSSIIGSGNITKHLARNEKLLTKLSMAKSTEYPPLSIRLKDIPSELPNDKPLSKCYSITPSVSSRKKCDIEKILENLLLATNKSSLKRVKAIETIYNELYLVPNDFLEDQANVILEITTKAMKRSNEVEQLAAIRMATLTVFQLVRKDRFCSELSNLFVNSLKLSIASNASICTALAFIELGNNESNNNSFLEPIMSLFRQIFSEKQSKQHKTLKEDGADNVSTVLRTKALEAWGLLLTICSLDVVYTFVQTKIIDELTELMMNNSAAEFRIVCGQVISLIVELGQLRQNEYFAENMMDTCIVMRNIIGNRTSASINQHKLLTTSLSKVLKYVEDGCDPSVYVKFDQEIHQLKTWSSIFKYQKLIRFIGANMAGHFLENKRIRAIVPISPKLELPFWYPQPIVQYRSAAMRKSRTRENRLNGRMPKFSYL